MIDQHEAPLVRLWRARGYSLRKLAATYRVSVRQIRKALGMLTVPPVAHLDPPGCFYAIRALDQARPGDPRTFLQTLVQPSIIRRCTDLHLHAQTGWTAALVALYRVAMPRTRVEADALAARHPETTEDHRRHAWLYWEALAPWTYSVPPMPDDTTIEPETARNRPGVRTHWPMG